MPKTWSEKKVTELIRHAFKGCIAKGALDFSDDAAVLPACNAQNRRVVSTDSFIEKIDFIHNKLSSLESAGHRAIVQNISDLAAMGASPVGFVWSLEIPKDWLESNAKKLCAFLKGASQIASKKQLKLFGGDLSFGKKQFSCTTTIFGDVKGKPLLRGGAKPGDLIFLSKPVGASKLGLMSLLKNKNSPALKYHLYPKDEIELGQRLVGLATTCIDISDGLAKDLSRVCRASNVSAMIADNPSLVHPKAQKAKQAKQLALSSGEEYALLFTISSSNAYKLKAFHDFILVGEIIENPKKKPRIFFKKNTQPRKLKPLGFDHFSSFSLGQAPL